MARNRYPDDEVTRRVLRTWHGMKARCLNLKDPNYGGRGITVCERWRDDFAAFLADMGLPPTRRHSIDRHPNNDGNYEPGNCRWATPRQQARNNRRSLKIVYQGVSMNACDWADQMGFSRASVRVYITRDKYDAPQIIEAETAKRVRRIARRERLAAQGNVAGLGSQERYTFKVGKCPICGHGWHYGPRNPGTSAECPHTDWHPSGWPPWILAANGLSHADAIALSKAPRPPNGVIE